MSSRLRVVLCVALVALSVARPLEWFAEEPTAAVEDIHKGIPNDLAMHMDKSKAMYPPHTYKASEPTSFLQVMTGGHPLECDCERVKCNCVKRCECQLPTGQQNHVASSFLEIASGSASKSAPLFVDIDSSECFLETGESVGQDQHHMLDCECDKVKCNCVKHCECSLPSSSAGAQTGGNALVQVEEGTAAAADKAAATENLLQTEEGLQTEKAFKKDLEEDEHDNPVPAEEEDGASTESFMKDVGMEDGPSEDAPRRSKMSAGEKKTQEVGKAAPADEDSASEQGADGNYNYNYNYAGAGAAYDYKYDEKSDYDYEYQHE